MRIETPEGFAVTNLALRFANDQELTRAVKDKAQQVIEWRTIGYTFIMSPRNLVIVRAGALGGDLATVHGGWKYLTAGHMHSEWREINLAARAFVPWKRRV